MGSFFIRKYRASSVIEADGETVWKVLTDLDRYPIWNPFTPNIDARWIVGEKVLLTVNMKEGGRPILQTEYITCFDPPNLMGWGMNWGILLRAERIQTLNRVSAGRTIYFTEDVIRGLLSPIVHLIYGKSVQKGFEAVAQSLKCYVENNGSISKIRK